jgi:putative membrane protein
MKSIVIGTALVFAAAGIAAAQPGQTSDQGQMSERTGAEAMGGGMSDANLAAMIKTINDGEIKEAKIAEKHARNKKVKSYAKMMIKDHGANNQKVASVSKRLGLQPAQDQETASLEQETRENARTLEGQSGEDFDKAYMDQMVKDHTKALQKLDDAIGNNAGRNEQLAELLKKTRQTVSHHLDEAKKVQSELESSSTRDTGRDADENKSGY